MVPLPPWTHVSQPQMTFRSSQPFLVNQSINQSVDLLKAKGPKPVTYIAVKTAENVPIIQHDNFKMNSQQDEIHCTLTMVIRNCTYTVSQKTAALACCNFDVYQPILIIFGRNVAKKVRSQMVLCFCVSKNY